LYKLHFVKLSVLSVFVATNDIFCKTLYFIILHFSEKRGEFMKKTHYKCHSRIVATALSRGLGTYNDF
jgi:hypothetical protein